MERRGHRPTCEEIERRRTIGRLLEDESLSLAEIARRTEMSRERVRQIQRAYFPATPRRPRLGGRNQRVI
jgi:hypothetical protein